MLFKSLNEYNKAESFYLLPSPNSSLGHRLEEPIVSHRVSLSSVRGRHPSVHALPLPLHSLTVPPNYSELLEVYDLDTYYEVKSRI